jgi:hypothetical protein
VREFASTLARAATLPRAAKVLYTAFCAFIGVGVLSCAGLYQGIVAFSASATPAELYVRLIAYYQTGISSRALLEVTHSHLFSVPMYLLVLGHLFFLCGLPARTKLGWIAASVAFSALHLAAPWAVRFGGASLAWLYPISGAGMLASFAVMMFAPLYEMWMKPARTGSVERAITSRAP